MRSLYFIDPHSVDRMAWYYQNRKPDFFEWYLKRDGIPDFLVPMEQDFQDQINTQGKANRSRKNSPVEKKKPDTLGNMATEI